MSSFLTFYFSPSFSLLSVFVFFHYRTVRERTMIWNWWQLPPHRICIGLRTFRNQRRDEKQKTGRDEQTGREATQKKITETSLLGGKRSKLTAVEIHIKLRKWQVSSLAASSIKNLPTCLSVPLSVSADFRLVVHQNGQSKTVGATWWHSGTIVQHGRCDQGNFYSQTWALAHLRFLGLHFCFNCGGTHVLVIIGKHIDHYFGVVCFV